MLVLAWAIRVSPVEIVHHVLSVIKFALVCVIPLEVLIAAFPLDSEFEAAPGLL